MKFVTDHATWCDECDKCGEYLSVDSPGVRVFGKVLCLDCARAIIKALETQAEADKEQER